VTGQILHGLARGVARALGSAEIRARFFGEHEATPYIEQRIALKRLLTQNETWRHDILENAEIGLGWDALASRLPELELYFPVERHREAWQGQQGLRVAVALGDGTYRSWGADGSSFRLQAGTVPDEPTLLLGPSEIDYDDAESARIGGSRTGPYLERLAAERGLLLQPQDRQPRASHRSQRVSDLKSASTSNDTYLTYYRVSGEFDGGGLMEISVWATIDGAYQVCQRFTGIQSFTDYYLPAPGASGSRKIALAVPTGTTTANVTAYEDDDTSCSVGGSDTNLGVANLQILHFGTIYGTSNGRAAVRVEAGPHCGNSTCENSENSGNCCQDCGATCGDGFCNCGESRDTCLTDCKECGDDICDPGEEDNCFIDCGSQCPPCIICPC
jgi:hypothetical protein